MAYQNLTAKELAERAGISINTLNMYIGQRESIPAVDIAYKIASALNIPLEKLVTTDTESTKTKQTRDEVKQKICLELDKMTDHQVECFYRIFKSYIAVI